MSRIGKAPIDVPAKVDVTITGSIIIVKGPLGELKREFLPCVSFVQEGNVITVVRENEERFTRSAHGLSRTLLNNMVVGVSAGFVKNLELVGVGYRAAVEGNELVLQLGFSHPVRFAFPEGVKITVDGNTKIQITGYDKQAVGDAAAKIRAFRKPEPYKGKGVRFQGEKIRRKAGKAGKK
jgi:large subunit ribosomal protein L6